MYAVNIAANQTSVSLSDVIDRRTRVPLNVDGSQIQNIPAVQPDYVNEIVADLFGSTSTVLSGGIPTANSSVHNQLDVTAADIYFADGQRVSFAASQNGQFVTTTASTTYYLDYNSDGTTSFGLSHSIKSGYVPIAQVETDSSGNIASVTNVRPTIVNMFGTTDNVVFGGNVQAQKFIGDGSQLTNLPIGNIVAGTGIEITANGNSDTITNTGVLSVNGQTGAVTVQGYSPLTNPMAWIG
ncbi:hypothetical protein N007_05025 [Alicyclobacillus acidoterrestris ATCC 49025]|nr:hypothetical protein N007_05025 [Alicyclobacillus acidoterrestris ATCC 49025]